MEDIQSWWEVPSIAYFCSLFRTAFNLLDFDIEELEEALLTDGTEESACSLLTELIVRLLNGCLGNNDISAFNYQMYLRRLFRRKCQATGRYNPFNTDIDFQFLPLRTKVEILYALCDFRLDAEDVFDLFKNLEAESLRVEPLGWDDNDSAYWYFYGTRLYREDIIKKSKSKSKKKKSRESRKRGWFYGDDWLDDEETDRVWQVVCFTEDDWTHLTEKFSKASSKVEKELYRSLSQNFLPEIPRLFQEKERLQRKRLLELAPRRTSSRVLQKIKQKEEEIKQTTSETRVKVVDRKQRHNLARENRAKRRNLIRTPSTSNSSEDSTSEREMPQKMSKRKKSQEKRSKSSSSTNKGEPPPEPPPKPGRKTNNSLASATGQIVIEDNEQPVNSTRKKLKTSQIFSQTEEDVQTDMYKVLEQLTAHEDAWPFLDPVEEEYAPNYYAVIRRPMDLHKMEERLDSGYYSDFSMFKADFKLIVNNCRLYNGQDNEYTIMVDNLQTAFDRLTEKYIHRLSSSDEEIAVEYPLPTPSRKHKLKNPESPANHKKKKRKSHSDTGDIKSTTSDQGQEAIQSKEDDEIQESEHKESHKSKEGKIKKKRKGHRRHSKHSKNHKNHKSEGSKSLRHSRKEKHLREGKKSKQKKKKSKHSHVNEDDLKLNRTLSQESLESSNRSRSASPLPSIHTPTPSPPEPEQPSDPDFYKDKYDKIKERRRTAAKDAWESLFDSKQKSPEKHKHTVSSPGKEKNQKLRETIEKLKAKNEKYKDTSLYNSLFPSTSHSSIDKGNNDSNLTRDSSSKDNTDDYSDNDFEIENQHKGKHGKGTGKKTIKKNSTAKNESASEALEQAVKDISKLLDDAPKGSTSSSPCDSPAQTISTEDQENSRQDDESSQSEKGILGKKDASRKRPSSREPKVVKRREIQRTIERLQPGKSKGNLLSNVSTTQKIEEVTPCSLNKVRDPSKVEESSPKLSLGSVLPTVEFTLGNDHNFDKSEEIKTKEQNANVKAIDNKNTDDAEISSEKKSDNETIVEKDIEDKVEPEPLSTKLCQEKATPNLSAWFKAFGAPKSTSTVPVKKKVEENEHDEKPVESSTVITKTNSPKNTTKYDSPTDEISPNPEGGDSPLLNVATTSRQRRTSTGSSVSERSSFSQDLDSPRHQIAHTSPLLRSPASPRTDDFQKITYPIINGTVRAGFYQDTTSIKSSPEKSCSPREAPQSPFSPYSQHVYASNNSTGSSTPNYFIDHNKSPLPTYGQNQPPPYYDSSKAPVVTKPVRSHDDYIALCPDTFQPNQYSGPYTSAPSPYTQGPQSPSPYAQGPQSPYAENPSSPQKASNAPAPTPSVPILPDCKNTLFPMKKRVYNESEHNTTSNKKVTDLKENISNPPNKEDYQKMVQSVSSLPSTSVDDIATALIEKSEMGKLNTTREQNAIDYTDRQRHIIETHNMTYENNETMVEKKKEVSVTKHIMMSKKDNIDMINMGYNNSEIDRRIDTNELEFVTPRELTKTNITTCLSKGYEVEAIAMNLGINSQQHLQKPLIKTTTTTNILQPQEKTNLSIGLSQNVPEYEAMSMSSQHISNFSLNDIENANKKLYSCNAVPSNTGVDYGNWKITNQMRKPEMIPPAEYRYYIAKNSDKMLAESNAKIAYNKCLQQQQQQFQSYNSSRSNIQRTQDLQQNLPSELRIPNPRGLLNNDNTSTSLTNNDLMGKNAESTLKTKNTDKLIQSHPLVSSLQYKSTYGAQLESLRNLQNIPQMLERYTNDERYLSSFAAGTPSLYNDKSFQMAQIFNKSVASDVHPASTSVSIYSQPSVVMSKDTNIYKRPINLQTSQVDVKGKNKRKRTSDTKQSSIIPNQNFHTSTCNTEVLSSVKSSMVPGSAFNFGSSTNMALGGGLYGDNTGFSIEDFRNSTANQLMAANYMAAAVAHQRNNTETNTEKLVKPAHQNTPHSSPAGSFPFISHSQVRAGYQFVGTDPSSPLYQQYLQRHQEELLRQTGAQIMGLYPPGYPGSLSVRQPYDSINRPSWI